MTKYLSENNLPNKILATFLVAPAYDDENYDYSMADFVLPNNFDRFLKQSRKIFIYTNHDDPAVSQSDFAKYEQSLPSAIFKKFPDRGHFNQEEIPELIADVKNL